MENEYYWMINKHTYSVDGVEIPKGRMIKKRKGERPIINDNWRRATEREVESKLYRKGNYFNLRYV